jgi:hypothetical protein
MNKGEEIYQIKQALKKLFSLTEEKVKSDTEMEKKSFTDFEVEDGTKLTTPGAMLEVGGDVFGINLDGNQFPLNNGDYKLTDGRVVTVEDNKVKSISEPAENEVSPVTSADLGKTKMEEEGEVIVEEKDKEEEMEVEIEVGEGNGEGNGEDRMAKIEETIAKILVAIDEIQKAHSEMMGNMKKFSEEPAAASIKMSKGISSATDPKEFNKRKKISEIEELREIIKKNKSSNNNIEL